MAKKPVKRNINLPAQNPQTFLPPATSIAAARPGFNATHPLATNPMFGRPTWSYVRAQHGPVLGPQVPKRSGTGKTGRSGLESPLLPAYVSDPSYFPSTFSYAPVWRSQFEARLPRTVGVGNDGMELVGTYRAHDFTPADRWNHQLRQADNWQDMTYPPSFRNLLAWQQVMRYRVISYTLMARPLQRANYFLGYQMDPRLQAQLGQSALGVMGSQ